MSRYHIVLSMLLVLLAACNGSSSADDAGPADGPLTEGFSFPDIKAHEFAVTPTDGASTGDIDPNDLDGDKLTNDQEKTLGTDPNNADTDNDKIPDGQEVGDINNPKDTDGDKKLDAMEPDNFDSDGDKTMDSKDSKDDDGDCSASGTKGPPRLFYNANYEKDLKLTKACSPYKVLGHLWMLKGSRLSTENGVQVNFGPGAALKAGNNATTGVLEITGSSTQPIILTADSSAPKKGFWRGIVVENGGKLTLQHTQLSYAGMSSSANPSAAVYVKAATQISLSNASFMSSLGTGLHAAFAAQSSSGKATLFSTFKNCKFSGLSSSASLNIGHLGEIGAGNSFGIKGSGGEVRVAGKKISYTATWKNIGVPYIFLEDEIYVDANLWISAGAEFVVRYNSVIRVGWNSVPSLAVLGTSASRVSFAPVKVEAGKWQGIIFYAGTHQLHNTTISGAGGANSSGPAASIYVDYAVKDMSIKGVQINTGAGYGAYYYRKANGCSFTTATEYSFTGISGCKMFCLDDNNSPGACLKK